MQNIFVIYTKIDNKLVPFAECKDYTILERIVRFNKFTPDKYSKMNHALPDNATGMCKYRIYELTQKSVEYTGIAFANELDAVIYGTLMKNRDDKLYMVATALELAKLRIQRRNPFKCEKLYKRMRTVNIPKNITL